MDTSSWRHIPGYEGLYKVSPDGQIYSNYSHRIQAPRGHIANGDISYMLQKDGERRVVRLSAIMAAAYSKERTTVELVPKRQFRMLTYKGETKPLTTWAKELGIDKGALRRRLDAGLSMEEAAAAPYRFSDMRITCRGETLRVSEWAKRTEVPLQVIYKRLKSGFPPEEAIFNPLARRGRPKKEDTIC